MNRIIDTLIKPYLTEKLNEYDEETEYDTYDEWFTDIFLQETTNEWTSSGNNFWLWCGLNDDDISAALLCRMLNFITEIKKNNGFVITNDVDWDYNIERIVNEYVYWYVYDKGNDYWIKELDAFTGETDDEEEEECSGEYCCETKNLIKAQGWNRYHVSKNDITITKLFCEKCYEIDGKHPCRGCSEFYPYNDLDYKFGGGFGYDVDAKQLFCKTCIDSISKKTFEQDEYN